MNKSITLEHELEIFINGQYEYTEEVEVDYSMEREDDDSHPDFPSASYDVAVIDTVTWKGEDITELISQGDRDNLAEEIEECQASE